MSVVRILSYNLHRITGVSFQKSPSQRSKLPQCLYLYYQVYVVRILPYDLQRIYRGYVSNNFYLGSKHTAAFAPKLSGMRCGHYRLIYIEVPKVLFQQIKQDMDMVSMGNICSNFLHGLICMAPQGEMLG